MIDLVKKIFKRTGVDRTVYLCVFILTVFGIIMIGSASIGQTASKGTMYATVNMLKQTVFVGVGYLLMIIFARCFKKKWVNSSFLWIFYLIGILAMLICLLWGDTKGSHAWIHVGPITIQPSEFMKILMILFSAFHFGQLEEMCIIPKNISRQKREELQMRKIWYCILKPIIAIFGAFVIVGFVQKDLGSALILGFVCMMLFFCTPRPYFKKWKKLFIAVLIILAILFAFSAVFILKPHQLARFTVWLNPLSDPTDSGFQLTNALIAFSYGGLFGKGFGSSTQKYGYIPESHNDFITAIIYEELGLAGFLLFLIPYCIIIYKMFYYGSRVKDTKSQLILYGVGIYFFTHLLVNVGGVSGLIPMTGVPLLLISSGGSSTIAAMIALGIAQSLIARYNRDLLKEQI